MELRSSAFDGLFRASSAQASIVAFTAFPTMLTDPLLQNLTTATATFRFYAYHGATGGPAEAFDGLTRNGTASPVGTVPVQATHFLVLAGLSAAFVAHRRTR